MAKGAMVARKGAHSDGADVVRDLFGTVSEGLPFEQSLHRLGQAAFGSRISGLHGESLEGGPGRLALAGALDASDFVDWNRSYASRWSAQNLWMERSLEGFRRQGFQHGDAVVGDAELLASPYYQHFLKPLDIRHGLGIVLWSDGKRDLALASFHRGHRDRRIDAGDLAMVIGLRPHLVNAYAIARRLSAAEQSNASLRAGFDAMRTGMIVLDSGGRVMEANAAAEEALFSLSLARRDADGRIAFRSARLQHAFDAALRRLADDDAEPVTVALFGPERARRGTRPVLHLCKVPIGALAGVGGRARLIGFVVDLQTPPSARFEEEAVCVALGLGRAEARIAIALRQHADVAGVALELGLGVATVRTHIRSIHAKLGVRRNGDLVRVVERLLGGLPRR